MFSVLPSLGRSLFKTNNFQNYLKSNYISAFAKSDSTAGTIAKLSSHVISITEP